MLILGGCNCAFCQFEAKLDEFYMCDETRSRIIKVIDDRVFSVNDVKVPAFDFSERMDFYATVDSHVYSQHWH